MSSFGKRTVHRILVPVDLGVHSQVAFDWALSMAADDADVFLLNVLDPAHRAWSFLGREYSAARVEERMRTEVSTELDELSKEAPEHCRIHTRIVVGNPAERILRFAEDEHVDLVVMPTRSQEAVGRFTLGGVTDKVIRRAPCPVVAVPPKAHAPED